MNCSDWKQTNKQTTPKSLELLRNGSLSCEHEKQILILPFVSIYSPNLKKAPLGNKLECRSIWMEIQCNFSFCIQPNWFFKYTLHRGDSSQPIKSKALWGSVPLQTFTEILPQSSKGGKLALHLVPLSPLLHTDTPFESERCVCGLVPFGLRSPGLHLRASN